MLKALLSICLCPVLTLAATLPTGFTESSIGGITNPTAMTFAPDGRLFVCQQGGQLRLIRNGALVAAPYLTVTTTTSGERGLLGVAVGSGFIYIYYTVPGSTAHNRLSRFPDNGGDTASGSEQVLVDFDNLSSATNHNGGAIHFSPTDGKLYVAIGENANSANAQTLNNRLGKVHRYNPDGSIPANNPFFNTATGANRSIWALGLRNPFTFAFQPGTGRMFINDVGDTTYEEINDGVAGANYGWPPDGPQDNPLFTNPFYYYAHSGGAESGCAIAGGTFYNPDIVDFPSSYVGHYFFSDLCTGFIRLLNVNTKTTSSFATGISNPVDLAVSSDGKLYYLARGSNAVFIVDFTGAAAPSITQHPQSITVSTGQPATFTVAASGAQPLSYQWQRNTVPINGATSTSYTLQSASLNDNQAQFRAVVTNSAGSATSNSATLTVTPNQPPSVTINAPSAGSFYTAGTQVLFSGMATDPEDGNIPAANYCWQVDFHHDTHTHPFFAETCGITSGSVNIPNAGETATNVWYRFYLRVRDSSNNLTERFVDVFPRVVTLTVASSPPSLQLTVDGQPVTSSYSFTSVVGMLRTIGAVTPQASGNITYRFALWSDNGLATHNITTPSSNTTYTATYAIDNGCTYSLGRQSGSYSAVGDLGRVEVITSGSCPWLAITNAGWIFFPSGAGSTGSGPLVFELLPNFGQSVRSTNIEVAGIEFQVRQSAQSCQFRFAQPETTVPGSGGTFQVQLQTQGGCSWQTAAAPDWLTVTQNSAGTGSATISFAVAANPGTLPRTATIQAGGETHQILQQAANPLQQFGDVPVNHLFFSHITLAATNDIMPGCTAAGFCPDEPIIRSQMAQYLIRALVGGDNFFYPMQPYFTDVPPSHPQFSYIQKLRQLGVTNGCTATMFCPGDLVTRGQMAAFLIRSIFELPASATFPVLDSPYFADAGQDNIFFAYVQKLRELAITGGCTANTFCPNDTLLKGQIAVFLVRAFLTP